MTVVEDLAKAVADLKAAGDALAAMTTRAEAAEKALAGAEQLGRDSLATVQKLTGDLKAAEDLLTGEQTAHTATKDALAKVQAAVASNPAFADAAAKGSANPPAAGAPGADEQAKPNKTRAQWDAEYKAIRDGSGEGFGPVAAAKFRSEHAKELGIS